MTKLVDVVNSINGGYTDSGGNLTSPTASMVSDRYGMVSGQLMRFHGDGTNLAEDSVDLEAAGYTHTVTIDDATHFTATAQNQTVYDTIATTALDYYCFSFKARDMSAANTSINVYHNASATGNSTALTGATVYKWDSTNKIWDSDTSTGLSTTLTRYYVVVLGKTGDGNVEFGLQDANASAWTQIEFTEIQVENLSNLTTAPGPEMFDAETLGSELVTNGGMETGAGPDNWTDTGTPTTSERSSEQAHGGTYSNKITVNAQYEGTQQIERSLTAGKIYKATASIYGDGSNKFVVRVYEPSGTSHYTPLSVNNVGYAYPASWTTETWYFIATDTTAAAIFMIISGTGVTAGTVYLDDVSLKEVTAPDKGIPEDDPQFALLGAEANTEEDASSPPGTTEADDVSLWNNTGFDTFESEADPHLGHGTHSAHFVAGDEADSAATDEITVTDNTLYRVSFFYKLAANDAQTYAKYSIGETGTLEKYKALTNLTATAWTEVVNYLYTDGTDLVITIANGGTDADVDINVDSVSVRPVQTKWAPVGTNTIEVDETNDALLITYVDNDKGVSLALSNAADLDADLTVGHGYTVEFDAIAITGACDLEVAESDDTELDSVTISTAAEDTYTLNFVATHATTNKLQFDNLAATETVRIRNLSIKENTLLDSEPRTYTATSGGTATIPAEIPLTDNGIQFDGEGTNLLPYSDDFTEWTTSNITDTADQEGPDGITNSATSLLATAANGTILYDLDPLASTDYYFTIWMKRITGTGNIQLTDDNGSNYTTKTLTTTWTKFGVTRSQANPHVGIKIVTNTDKIAVFRGQVEASKYYTSSIPTNSTPVTRTTMAQDTSDNGVQWTLSSALQTALSGGATAFTLIAEWTPYYNAADTAADHGILGIQDSADSLLSIDASDDPMSNDGTSEISAALTPVAETAYLLGVTGTFSSTWNVGFSADGGASWTFDSESQAMDSGGFTKDAGNFLKPAFGNELPWYLGRVRIWDTAFSTAQMTAGAHELLRSFIRGGNKMVMK